MKIQAGYRNTSRVPQIVQITAVKAISTTLRPLWNWLVVNLMNTRYDLAYTEGAEILIEYSVQILSQPCASTYSTDTESDGHEILVTHDVRVLANTSLPLQSHSDAQSSSNVHIFYQKKYVWYAQLFVSISHYQRNFTKFS